MTSSYQSNQDSTTRLLKELFSAIVALICNSLIAFVCLIVRIVTFDKKNVLTKSKIRRIRFMDGFKKRFFVKHEKIKKILKTY